MVSEFWGSEMFNPLIILKCRLYQMSRNLTFYLLTHSIMLRNVHIFSSLDKFIFSNKCQILSYEDYKLAHKAFHLLRRIYLYMTGN